MRLVLALVMLLAAFVTTAAAQTPTVVFGARHALALASNGDVLTWGDNVMCQLGRGASSGASTPAVVLRNAIEVAAAADHSLALTADGKVYGWGANPEGQLGMGHTFDQCEGPTLVPSLAGKKIVHIATGNGFSVAVADTGDLYCSGDNGMGQCPAAKRGRVESFTQVPIAELAGNVGAVKAGAYHVLAQTKDGALYAFGRGRDGQLGNGRTTNGMGRVADLREVVSFSAGTWHSAAVTADGSLWLWGNNAKSQLCDGTTTNRATPSRVALPDAQKVTEVAAGAHATVYRTASGDVLACGDNQFGALGAKTPTLPTPVTIASGTRPSLLAVGGSNAVFTTDGCNVRSVRPTERLTLSLCAERRTTALPDLVRVPPSGGVSGCWASRNEEDGSTNPMFAALRQAMLAAEGILKQNAAFTTAPVPVRYRTSLSAGPYKDGGARMHVQAVPERKMDGTRVWSKECEVIPQIDRIGGAIFQISIFFNNDVRGQFVNDRGTPPKLTGQVAGYPEYDGWIVMTKDGRLPWIPQTLADRLDVEGEKRRRALADWNTSRASMKSMDPSAVEKTYEMLKKTDPSGAEKFLTTMKQQAIELERQQKEVFPARTAALEQQVVEYETYRASFTPEQLKAPAVWGDTTGAAKRKLDAQIAAIRKSTPDRENAGIEIAAATARYDLVNLQPGATDRALGFKLDPTFPDRASPDRIQLITVMFSQDPDAKQVERRAWQQRVRESFDFAALAALLK